jgi:hypothetical protein
MHTPQIRPGKVQPGGPHTSTLVVLFRNAAQANSVIQLAIQLGVPSDRLGVTPSDGMPGGQGALLTIPCPNDSIRDKVEAICKAQGAVVRGQRS